MAGKHFKQVWANDILKKHINDFNTFLEHKFSVKEANAGFGAVAVGDFNGDGKEDMLIAYYGDIFRGHEHNGPAAGQLVLLYGKGNGKFRDATSSLENDGRINIAIGKFEVGDFNGDGIDDVVAEGHNEDGRGNDDQESYAAPQISLMSSDSGLELTDLGFSTWGHTVAQGDLNGDGLQDFLISGFTKDEGHTSALFLQNSDGSLTKRGESLGGLFVEIGDFDGDGQNELCDTWEEWAETGSIKQGLRVVELNADGSVASSNFSASTVYRTEMGVGWNGAPMTFDIMLDGKGDEFIDVGLHFADAGDINGDGREDLVAFRFASELKYVNGVLKEGAGKSLDHMEFYTLGKNGMELMDSEVRGWGSSEFGIRDIQLLDWDGDGDLDIYMPWTEQGKDGRSEGARIFTNDGEGNFVRVSPKMIPHAKGDMINISVPIDANGDGKLDIMTIAAGFDRSWNEWGPTSEQMHLAL